MILRLAAVAAALVGLLAFGAYLQLLGKSPFSSPEMRHLRAMKDRDGEPARADTLSFAAFAALPAGRPVAEYSGIERRGAVIEGWVQRMLRAADGDVHLELAPAPRAPGDPDTVYATAEITPAFWRGSARWSYPGLVEAFRPNRGGTTPWEGGPRRVRLTGWLLYDFQHETRLGGVPGPRLGGVPGPRVGGWEIHPVTRIEIWNDSLGTFVEHAR